MSARMLSLSFRPKAFEDLVGQSHVVKIIRKQMASGRMPAAWLLEGGSGNGKTTIARIIANEVGCVNITDFDQNKPPLMSSNSLL